MYLSNSQDVRNILKTSLDFMLKIICNCYWEFAVIAACDNIDDMYIFAWINRKSFKYISSSFSRYLVILQY